jgi:molecular chaperone DnaK
VEEGCAKLSYPIGVDLGATFTAAAVRLPEHVEMAPLGARTPFIPTVAAVATEGSLVFGEDAAGWGRSDRVVHQFIRRVGDDIPLLLGGVSVTAEALAARLASSVVDTVAARSGEPARRVAITHPASWGSHRVAALRTALSAEDLGTAVLLSSAQASAMAYADRTPVAEGDLVAVYDLGGTGLDAAVVRRSADGGFTLAGRAEEADIGGLDFDELVFEHVRTALGEQWSALDGNDPAVLAGVARLRAACTAAKERLSTDTEAWISVAIPGIDAGSGGAVRLVRAELEEMIRPAVEETVAVLLRAVSSAGAEPEDLAVVLLTGGSARIPLVTQVVSEVLGRPVTVAENPKADTAAGAALAAAGRTTALAIVAPRSEGDALAQTLIMPRVEDESSLPDGSPPPPPRAAHALALPELPAQHRRRYVAHGMLAGCGVGLAVLLLGGWMWSTNVGGPPGAGANDNKPAAVHTAPPSSRAPTQSPAPSGPRSATHPNSAREHTKSPSPASNAPSPTRSPILVTVAPPPPTTRHTPSRTPTRSPSDPPPTTASPSPSPTSSAAGLPGWWFINPTKPGSDYS